MKAFVVCPTAGIVDYRTVCALLKIYKDPRCLDIFFPEYNPVERGYNRAVEEFLKTDATHMLSIEVDNVPEKNPLELLELDKDILGCPYPISMANEMYLTALKLTKNQQGGYDGKPVTGKGLMEVDAVCMGCTMISRRVLENMKYPFRSEYHENGKLKVGFDYNFCIRAKEAGWKVWTHFDYMVDHIKGGVSLLQVYRSLTK